MNVSHPDASIKELDAETKRAGAATSIAIEHQTRRKQQGVVLHRCTRRCEPKKNYRKTTSIARNLTT